MAQIGILLLTGCCTIYLFKQPLSRILFPQHIVTEESDPVGPISHSSERVVNEEIVPAVPCIIDDPLKVRQVFHQLHALENHPEILPLVRNTIIQLIDRVDLLDGANSRSGTIYDVRHYTVDGLREWIDATDSEIMAAFQQYSERRKNGSPRELFRNSQEASRWLKQGSPLRFVDGAWLGHLSRTNCAWVDADLVRQLWQIMSEELGDGDQQKHHTYLYARLLRACDPRIPDAHDAEFTMNDCYGASDPSLWRSALQQLMISLFYQDFLPEVLGFNLHFERVTLETLQAMTELREVGLDPTYFMLHVCIDNAATGHTALALDAVCEYLARVEDREGAAGVQTAWRRVQAGYALSARGGKPHRPGLTSRSTSTYNLETCVANMFEAKVKAGSGAHCLSRALIGGRKIIDWLSPAKIGSSAWWAALTRSLGDSRAWITAGNAEKSRFVKEVSWGGRMFGAFTASEISVLRAWINHLPEKQPISSLRYPSGPSEGTAGIESGRIQWMDPQVALTRAGMHRDTVVRIASRLRSNRTDGIISDRALRNCRELCMIWFSHFCLLEKLVSLPSRTANPLSCTILRILRLWNSFEAQNDDLDNSSYEENEIRQYSVWDPIFGPGYQILDHYNLIRPRSLADLAATFVNDDFSEIMFCMAAAPLKNEGLLIGMAAGFVNLHSALSVSSLLDHNSGQRLRGIVKMERMEFGLALGLLSEDKRDEYDRGLSFVIHRFKEMFGTGRSS